MDNKSIQNWLGPENIHRLLDHLWLDFKNEAALQALSQTLKDYKELVLRLMLPHYEEARAYLSDAYNDGFIERDAELSQARLKAVIAEYQD